MYLLRIACILAFAAPVLAADPPKPAVKSAVKKLYSLHTPSGWFLGIYDDGSGSLGFGASLGDTFPAETFKPAEVRKVLDKVKLDTKGGESSHFVFWYEEERKAPDNGPPPRYTQDEKVIVPLFEKAADARKQKGRDVLPESLGKKRPPFGLKKVSAFVDNNEQVVLPAGEPPQFFIVTAVNKEGLVVQRRYPPTKEVDAPAVIEYKSAFKTIKARTTKGALLTPEEVVKRVTPGHVVLVSADENAVDPAFLEIIKEDTVILSGVLPQKGATGARVE